MIIKYSSFPAERINFISNVDEIQDFGWHAFNDIKKIILDMDESDDGWDWHGSRSLPGDDIVGDLSTMMWHVLQLKVEGIYKYIVYRDSWTYVMSEQGKTIDRLVGV